MSLEFHGTSRNLGGRAIERAQRLTRVACIAALVCCGPCASIAVAADPPTAATTDPVTLGWMVGTPPPPDRSIRFDDGSHYRFPQWRWSFSHWRELMPTANVSRGAGPVAPLKRAERSDLDAVTFVPIGDTKPMTWAESLDANFTDGILVLHRGRIVYEKYFGALDAHRQHAAMSVTKSFVGTLAAMLIAEGKVDAAAPVTRYVPELAGSGFDGATVQQVLDMTTALDYSEDYADPRATFITYARAAGSLPTPPDAPQIRSAFDFTRSIRANGVHGEAFHYRSPNTDVVGWVIARATGRRLDALLEERVWSQIGMESDGAFQVDGSGTPFAPGGLTLVLRDLARFGETMRLGGRFNGRQVVPAAAVAEIRRGGDPAKFVGAGYPTLPGWSYHDQWWVAHDDHGVFMARGIHGQAIYVDPKAEMVIVRFASYPKAGNVAIDPTSLPAYRAVAERLMRGH
jgi:CubicO group peptidase (beta-lactamase class C family)